MNLHAVLARLPRAPLLVTGGVAVGLFLARELGELVPDNLAATICMFLAGFGSGWIAGVRWRKE